MHIGLDLWLRIQPYGTRLGYLANIWGLMKKIMFYKIDIDQLYNLVMPGSKMKMMLFFG